VYPVHCFNGVRDEGERWTDCGGSCAPCKEFPWVLVTSIVLFTSLAAVGVVALVKWRQLAAATAVVPEKVPEKESGALNAESVTHEDTPQATDAADADQVRPPTPCEEQGDQPDTPQADGGGDEARVKIFSPEPSPTLPMQPTELTFDDAEMVRDPAPELSNPELEVEDTPSTLSQESTTASERSSSSQPVQPVQTPEHRELGMPSVDPTAAAQLCLDASTPDMSWSKPEPALLSPEQGANMAGSSLPGRPDRLSPDIHGDGSSLPRPDTAPDPSPKPEVPSIQPRKPKSTDTRYKKMARSMLRDLTSTLDEVTAGDEFVVHGAVASTTAAQRARKPARSRSRAAVSPATPQTTSMPRPDTAVDPSPKPEVPSIQPRASTPGLSTPVRPSRDWNAKQALSADKSVTRASATLRHAGTLKPDVPTSSSSPQWKVRAAKSMAPIKPEVTVREDAYEWRLEVEKGLVSQQDSRWQRRRAQRDLQQHFTRGRAMDRSAHKAEQALSEAWAQRSLARATSARPSTAGDGDVAAGVTQTVSAYDTGLGPWGRGSRPRIAGRIEPAALSSGAIGPSGAMTVGSHAAARPSAGWTAQTWADALQRDPLSQTRSPTKRSIASRGSRRSKAWKGSTMSRRPGTRAQVKRSVQAAYDSVLPGSNKGATVTVPAVAAQAKLNSRLVGSHDVDTRVVGVTTGASGISGDAQAR
jgi:hypothetical protein